MDTVSRIDAWAEAPSYEHYMGRWSRRIAAPFVDWLDPPAQADWLEVGCGTGALTEAVLAGAAPRSILAVDASDGFVAHARSTIRDGRTRFEVAGARRLPAADAAIDVVASALVLNFITDRPAALAEMQRVLRPDGLLGFYVWDYPGGGIGFIDAFWKAAADIDPRAAALDESRRFPFCTRFGLLALCRAAGLRAPVIEPIETQIVFRDFDTFWLPFTLGAGPAPGYCAGLADDHRAALKAHLARTLGTGGTVRFRARAWAVKAQRRS
ncbi:class I SAM-dependent methyltransferase [Inquilinus sp. CA228]|uniref:class I SAM-dependent methyltransferase n=1 Tax=Inquilinus sp. CA228 TaxID=3455609 RepID=UPI003F8D0FB1